MAVGLERLLLIIDADAKGAVAGLKATGTAAEANLGVVQKQSAASQAAMVGVGIGAAYAGGRILTSLDGAVKAASNLNETVQFSQQVFGRQGADEIAKWAKTADDALGQSQNQATEAATTFAVFGKAAHLTAGELPGFSKELVQLAADMASAKNTTPQEAIDAIASALQGRTRPIREYGILLSDVTLKQKAFALGIRDSLTGVLTPQERVLATAATLFEQTGKNGSRIQGDFARTADQLANSQRRSSAAAENAAAAFGKGLLPVWKAGSAAGRELLGVFNDLPAAAQSAIAIGAFGAASVATIGGLVTLGAYALPKVAEGWSKVGVAYDTVTGRSAAATAAQERLAAVNEQATLAAENAAAATSALAEADALVAAGAGAATAPTAAAGVGATVATNVETASAAAVAALEEVNAAAAVTGEQLSLAFGTGIGQLELFDSAVTQSATTVELIGAAMTEAAGIVGAESAVMSADLQAAFAGGALGADFFAAPLAAMGELGAESQVLSAQLASAFTSGLIPVEAFDGAVLKSAADMQLLGDAALAATGEVDALAAAEVAAADKAALDAAAAGGSRLAGLGGTLAKGGGIVLTAVVAVDFALKGLDSLTGIEGKLKDSYRHLAAEATDGGRGFVKAFVDAARKEEAKPEWGDIFHIGESIANRFKLGGVGDSGTATYFKRTFENLLDTQGPKSASSFVESLKKINDEQDHSSDSYKRTNALIKEWTRAVNDAEKAAKGQAGATDDQAKSVDRFGLALDSNKSKAKNWADNLDAATSPILSAMDAVDAFNQATDKYNQAKTGSSTTDPFGIADAASAATAAQRSQTEAARDLAAATRRVQEAQAALAHAGDDPSRRKAATDALSSAEDSYASALDRSKSATDQSAEAARNLDTARAGQISQANALADAEDRIASARRSQAAAQRELQNANRDLAEKQAELAHVNPLTDPNRYRDLSGQVADLRDSQANAQDRVADATDATASAQRGLLQTQADAKAKQDELAASGDDVVKALINEQIQLAALDDFIKSHPDAIPGLKSQIHEWAREGLIAADVAQAWIDKLDALAGQADATAGSIHNLVSVIDAVNSLGLGAPPGAANADREDRAHGAAATPSRPRQQAPSRPRPDDNSSGFGGRAGFAVGGLIPGAGNSDTQPAMLTPGEYVIRKSAAAKLGLPLLDKLNSGNVPQMFATGGPVGPSDERRPTVPGASPLIRYALETGAKKSTDGSLVQRVDKLADYLATHHVAHDTFRPPSIDGLTIHRDPRLRALGWFWNTQLTALTPGASAPPLWLADPVWNRQNATLVELANYLHHAGYSTATGGGRSTPHTAQPHRGEGRTKAAFIHLFPTHPHDAQGFEIGGYGFVWASDIHKWIGGDLDKAYANWRATGSMRGYADGGLINGVGTQDTEHILAMPGEYVVKRDVVAKAGVGFMDRLNAGDIPKYAGGGLVGAAPSVSFPTPVQTGRWESDGDLAGRIAAAVAQAIAAMPRGEEHIHIDQTGYERPPSVSDTVRGVRTGKFLATRP